MNRVTVAAATLATAATATMAVAATVAPAVAAPRPAAAHPAAHAKAAATAQQANSTSFLPTQTASELDHGKYVTVVHCVGVDSPPPVHLGTGGVPLTVSGEGPSSAVFKMLKQADPYKTVYTCTVNVEERTPAAKPAASVSKKLAEHWAGCELAEGKGTSGKGWTRGGHGKGGKRCTRKVTLNTGFGGLARQVEHHRPAS
jgi:hypothetical protein